MRGINHPQHAPELARKLLAGVPEAIGGEIAKTIASTVPQWADHRGLYTPNRFIKL
jgi:hypothetical protein